MKIQSYSLSSKQPVKTGFKWLVKEKYQFICYFFMAAWDRAFCLTFIIVYMIWVKRTRL